MELKPEAGIMAAQLCAACMRENLLTVPAGERVRGRGRGRVRVRVGVRVRVRVS